jgi:ketosteroid isomerase-like protein
MPKTAIRPKIREDDDAQIHEHIHTLAQALRAKDIDALMAHYSPNVVTFDVPTPLKVQGVDDYRKNFESWFASMQGPIDYEIRDLHVAVGGDVAFCHHLGHVQSATTTGEKIDYWVRVTAGLKKLNGDWIIVHEHVSMPFHMETMKAAIDAKP